MNIHPSLLPAYAGGMDLDVHEEVIKRGSKVTGCTLHFIDEGADTGPIILQYTVPVEMIDTKERLKAKVQAAEQMVIPFGVQLFAQDRLWVPRDKVYVYDKKGNLMMQKDIMKELNRNYGALRF